MLNSSGRVLITGGAGFIGSHLCEHYLANNWKVVCLDDFSTGRKENIQHLLEHSHFRLVCHDICEPYNDQVDLILNFACAASPSQYQKHAIKTARTNFIGVMNMLNLAERLSCKIVQASTSEIYGDPQQHPQHESYWGFVNPIGVRSCYDEGKRVAETLCFDYRRSRHVDVKVVRIFNTFGPRMALDDGRVVSNFIGQALRNDPITIYGDGSQTRSFCYVDDLVRGIARFARQDSHPGPMNLGSAVEVSVQDIADAVIRLCASESTVSFLPLPDDDPKVRCPDLRLAKDLINWDPQIDLEKGLKMTIADIQSQQSQR